MYKVTICKQNFHPLNISNTLGEDVKVPTRLSPGLSNSLNEFQLVSQGTLFFTQEYRPVNPILRAAKPYRDSRVRHIDLRVKEVNDRFTRKFQWLRETGVTGMNILSLLI